jgi:hypothetical protein
MNEFDPRKSDLLTLEIRDPRTIVQIIGLYQLLKTRCESLQVPELRHAVVAQLAPNICVDQVEL